MAASGADAAPAQLVIEVSRAKNLSVGGDLFADPYAVVRCAGPAGLSWAEKAQGASFSTARHADRNCPQWDATFTVPVGADAAKTGLELELHVRVYDGDDDTDAGSDFLGEARYFPLTLPMPATAAPREARELVLEGRAAGATVAVAWHMSDVATFNATLHWCTGCQR